MKYLITTIRMDGKRDFEVVEAADIEKAIEYATSVFDLTMVGFKRITRNNVVHLNKFCLSGNPVCRGFATNTRKITIMQVDYTEYFSPRLQVCSDFAELKDYLAPLLKGDERVYENGIVARFKPTTIHYNVRMAYTNNCGELVLTFSHAFSYPRIFVGSSLEDCIQQAQKHYSVMKQF